jgi:hypothetical protein
VTTKKQRRLAVQTRRQAFEAEVKRTGLLAQKRDRERRERQKERALNDADRRFSKRRKEATDGNDAEQDSDQLGF